MNLLETFDHYISLPKNEAYNEYLDVKNIRYLKLVLNLFILLYVILFSVNLADNESYNFALLIALLALTFFVSFRILYKRKVSINNVRKFITFFLIFNLIALISIDIFYPNEEGNLLPKSGEKTQLLKNDSTDSGRLKVSVGTEDKDSYMVYFILFIILILIFKFTRIEIIQLSLISFITPLFAELFIDGNFQTEDILPGMLIGISFFVIALTSESKRRKKFFEQYDFYFRKNTENLRMKKELNYAREIQLSMLPEREAIINDLSIAGISVPANEVGGDYFDYFRISDSEVGIFICDVSGHGVASGLLLSGLRSCMHLILEDKSDPRTVIGKLNRMIRKTQNKKMFVTAIFAVFNLEKNKCMLYNAGHLPPYKISGESKEIFKIKKHGIALGAINNLETSDKENDVVFDFKKSDKIIFYTDGVNEAMNNAKTEYGLDNLEQFLNHNADKNAAELLDSLVGDIKKFTGDSLQRDDLTLLIVQRN